jgi:hypothetical protein
LTTGFECGAERFSLSPAAIEALSVGISRAGSIEIKARMCKLPQNSSRALRQ